MWGAKQLKSVRICPISVFYHRPAEMVKARTECRLNSCFWFNEWLSLCRWWPVNADAEPADDLKGLERINTKIFGSFFSGHNAVQFQIKVHQEELYKCTSSPSVLLKVLHEREAHKPTARPQREQETSITYSLRPNGSVVMCKGESERGYRPQTFHRLACDNVCAVLCEVFGL